MAEYIQNEDGTLTLVHETHQAYSEEWKKAQVDNCQGCTGTLTENQSEQTNQTEGLSNAD